MTLCLARIASYNPDMLPTSVFHKDTTESTMNDARSAVLLGYGHGTLCTASSQSSGRGRIPGRRWEDGEGALLFTLVIHESKYVAAYPLTQLIALALCHWLEKHHGLEPQIKWPNDVCILRAKIAGILVEKEGPFFLAGVGVNFWQSGFPKYFRQPATSLALVRGIHKGHKSSCVMESELSALLGMIERNLDAPPPIQEFISRLEGVGATAELCLGSPAQRKKLRGMIMGLQTDGALMIAVKSGKTRAVYSGEIEKIRINAK